jgi:glycosyltransferase involved in cell wall biosynthesis
LKISAYDVKPYEYSILIARMEPENNIETIINGVLAAEMSKPLLVIGDPSNKFGKKLLNKYKDPRIRFIGAVYDPVALNNLRYHSHVYFHGHSVGGTNPSLLEAMACNCNIIAHDNPFNRAVLNNDGKYFTNEVSLAKVIKEMNSVRAEVSKNANIQKIKERYNWHSVISAYEKLMPGVVP